VDGRPAASAIRRDRRLGAGSCQTAVGTIALGEPPAPAARQKILWRFLPLDACRPSISCTQFQLSCVRLEGQFVMTALRMRWAGDVAVDQLVTSLASGHSRHGGC